MRYIDTLIIHCSDSPFGNVEIIRDWHVNGNGWEDIGYHYVICNGFLKNGTEYNDYDDGKIEEGRDVEKIGAHCKGQNSHSIGICLIGVDKFSKNQLEISLPFLINELRHKYKIEKERVFGHYEFDKNKTCPNLDMDKIREAL